MAWSVQGFQLGSLLDAAMLIFLQDLLLTGE